MVSFLNRVHKNPRAPLVGGGLICKWAFMKVKEVTRWSNQMKVWLPPKVKAIHLAYISPSSILALAWPFHFTIWSVCTMHLPFYFYFFPLLLGSHSSLTFPSTFLIHIWSYNFTLHMLHRLNQTFDFFLYLYTYSLKKTHATCDYLLP